MDLKTFGRILFSQAALAGVNWALAHLTGLQIPFSYVVLPILAAALNAFAAWLRAQPGMQAAGAQPGLIARVF